MSFCENCGNKIRPEKNFCAKCGHSTAEFDENSDEIFDSVFGDGFSSRQPDEPIDPHVIEQSDQIINELFESKSDNVETAPSDSAVTIQDIVQQAPLGMVSEAIRKPNLTKAIAKALLKSLSLSALIMGPGVLLMMAGLLVPGMIWLFAGSFAQLAWNYRKPWRLGLFACLIPPVAAGVGYLIQLIFMQGAAPPLTWIFPAILVGIVIGVFRGSAHETFLDKGGVFARKTIFYLGIWAFTYAVTQALSMTTKNVLAIQGGLVTGALTTAMLITVSIVLLRKWKKTKPIPSAVIGIVIAGLFFATPDYAYAQDSCPHAAAKINQEIMAYYNKRPMSSPQTGSATENIPFKYGSGRYPTCWSVVSYGIGASRYEERVYIIDTGSAQMANLISTTMLNMWQAFRFRLVMATSEGELYGQLRHKSETLMFRSGKSWHCAVATKYWY